MKIKITKKQPMPIKVFKVGDPLAQRPGEPDEDYSERLRSKMIVETPPERSTMSAIVFSTASRRQYSFASQNDVQELTRGSCQRPDIRLDGFCDYGKKAPCPYIWYCIAHSKRLKDPNFVKDNWPKDFPEHGREVTGKIVTKKKGIKIKLRKRV